MEKYRAKNSENIFKDQDGCLAPRYKARKIKPVWYSCRERQIDQWTEKRTQKLGPLYFEVCSI